MRSSLPHYLEAGADQNECRLTRLYHFIIKNIQNNDVASLVQYIQNLARERYLCGYDIHEVGFAFNVLEEAIWKEVFKSIDRLTPKELEKILTKYLNLNGLP